MCVCVCVLLFATRKLLRNYKNSHIQNGFGIEVNRISFEKNKNEIIYCRWTFNTFYCFPMNCIMFHGNCYCLNRGKGDYKIDYAPAPRITEADKNNDKR